jgi:S-DNA-T family DNA segregation ATPase FtsK/SpoIIIE
VHVVFAVGEAELDVELRIATPGATSGDLVTALGGGRVAPGTQLLVDGEPVPPHRPLELAGLRPGAVLRLAPCPPLPTPVPSGPLELRLVGGLVGGPAVPLHPGPLVVGRSPDADVVIDAPTVSARHARIEVAPSGACTIADLGSRNGTRVDGEFATGVAVLSPDRLVELGAVQLAVRPPPARPAWPRPPRSGPVTFNRPPRPAPPPQPEPLAVPGRPPPPSPRSRFGWAAALLPLAMGAVMAALWDPRMAAFALFSPVMMVGTWLEDRRRARRERAEGEVALSAELERFRAALLAARQAEHERRQAAVPDLGEVMERATGRTTRLWERRPTHADFLRLRLGTGTVRWRPPLDPRADRPPEVDALVDQLGILERAPVEVDLATGHTLGVVGARPAVLALLRSLTSQATALHGPADLRLAVLTGPERAGDWDWAKWLPHTLGFDGISGRRLLGARPADVEAVLAALLEAPPASGHPGLSAPADGRSPVTLVVVDADGLTEGREAPARALLAGAGRPVAGLVMAPAADRLPALCTAVVELDGPDGLARYEEPATGCRVDDVLLAGVTEPTARSWARALAGVDDPEVAGGGASLPDVVPLLRLLGMETPTPDGILARWRGAGAVARPVATVGVTDQGPLVLDLVADGPHGLIAGTTGSGKSELLRTLVASMAAAVDPEHLTFVLVDYKGGSAFDVCARLPHTVGLVTDLDEHLGERALRCLEAELRHRERMLREAGASDVAEYVAKGAPAPLPRLVVVIDEFATMAAELPDFIDALVGIAQRGRSLGVHLLLATQRPSGAVKDNIRANTNLRIALRVQDAADSTDVLGTSAAAGIGRRQAGRGYARLGPGEVLPFQAALVTTVSSSASASPVEVRPFPFGPEPAGPSAGAGDGDEGSASDLARLVDTIAAAASRQGRPPPRRPWPEPLPGRLTLEDLEASLPPGGAEAAGGSLPSAPIGLADDPARQRQEPFRWEAAKGNLLLYGVAGSGTTTTLVTLALALARRFAPEQLHLYALDFGAGALAPLAALPHTGAVVEAAETERQLRLLRHLRAELERRRQRAAQGPSSADTPPAIVLLLDSYAGFLAAFDDLAGMALRDDLARLVADGPSLGIWVVATAEHPAAVPSAVAALVPEKLLFRLADRQDYSSFGIRSRSLPEPVPGRAVDAGSGLEVQIALPARGGAAAAVASISGRWSPGRRAPTIGVLPREVALAEVAGHARLDDGEWTVPLGVGDDDLLPDGLRFGEADHALVAGPARSGKSTALAAVATVVGRHRPDVVITAVAPRRSPLRDLPEVDRLVTSGPALAPVLAETLADPAPQLVLVDDADTVDDAEGTLAALLARRRPDLHVVAAGRADALRSAYGHWSREVRRSRLGLALKPEPDDGDLWQVAFPRRAPTIGLPGRGYLVVDGRFELFQTARQIGRAHV